MDEKLRETSNLFVEIINGKRQGEAWSRCKNSRLPFDVNVNLNSLLFNSLRRKSGKYGYRMVNARLKNTARLNNLRWGLKFL